MIDIKVEAALDEGEMLEIEQENRHILVAKVGGQYHAISNICSHARVLLSKGKLRGTAITCPLHGARFDIRSGKCLSGPAMHDLQSYDVIEENNDIIIRES